MNVSGRTWIFGDGINTDLIQPMHALLKPVEEQTRYVFEANRPGWVDLVGVGDVIVAGANFGTGSSRPAARVLKDLQIGGVIAESVNGLFFRNSVNYAFPVIACAGCLEAFSEGDIADFDLETGLVYNESTGTTLDGVPWAPEVLKILHDGGLVQQLRSEGLLVE